MTDAVEQKSGLTLMQQIWAELVRASRTRTTLAYKGLITVVVLIAYFTLVSIVVAIERRTLIDSVQMLDEIHQQEERQVALNILIARAILTVNENYFSPNVDVSSKILVLEIEAVLAGLTKVQKHYPAINEDIAMLKQGMAQLLDKPNRAVIADIRGVFHHVVINLDAITSDIRSRKQRLLEDYRDSHNRLAIEWIGFGVVGLGIFGGFMMFFFRRLTADIRKVQEHAMEVVRGYRGAPMTVTRNDEIGDLMAAVNHMQSELRARETQIELGRQQQFHKEKMAAVGSLAAAIAHEINNPLSAIVGIAQSMSAEGETRGCARMGAGCHPEMVMEQAQRVMHITRQIGEFSVPQSQEPELLDINSIVRSTCNFVSFDRRFRRVELEQKLDNNIPAVNAVADHLVQVLMNLLINAADALEGITDRTARIVVTTRQTPATVAIDVEDNGCGVPPELQDKIFNEHFTTKAPGKGSGLGLALCRSLVHQGGGNIELSSEPGKGTRLTVILPKPIFGAGEQTH